jgi:hypothetical protein
MLKNKYLLKKMKRARGPKPIPTHGLFARYRTIGKNDYGTRVVSESFENTEDMINAFNHAIACVDQDGLTGKVYYNRRLIFAGDISEARRCPAIQTLIPVGWKSKRELEEEERKHKVMRLEEGTELTHGRVHNGDLLWKDPLHTLHHQRPIALKGKEFVDPVTICFYRDSQKDRWLWKELRYSLFRKEWNFVSFHMKYTSVT